MDLFSTYGVWSRGGRGFFTQVGSFLIMWFTVLIPFAGLAWAGWWLMGQPSGWVDLTVFGVSYLLCGFGVTLGYHRLLAHMSFDAGPLVRGFFIALGAAAVQGPPIKWAAIHRRHHQKTDEEGDPHSPNLHDGRWWSRVKAFAHSHTGWLLTEDPKDLDRTVPDLAKDPVVRFVDRYYLVWVGLGIVLPALVGVALDRDPMGIARLVVFGFVARVGIMHHATWCVNSVCHRYGYRNFRTGDLSKNHAVIAALSLGEGWHNNHHAFPASARHGMRWFEFDPSYVVLLALKAIGLVRSVRVPAQETMERKGADVVAEVKPAETESAAA